MLRNLDYVGSRKLLKIEFREDELDIMELRKDEREKIREATWEVNILYKGVSKRPDLGSQALGIREIHCKDISVIGKRSGQGISEH